jgi:N6-adenosine-specific RNA methylase IME4
MKEETKINPKNAAARGLLDTLVIPHGGYKCIVADPPWQYGKWGAASDSETARKKFPNGQWAEQFEKGYGHLSVEEISSMPVGSIAADDCDLYLWTTGKYLPAAFDVMKAWGFKYCQTLTWCKAPRGTGQGGLYCPTTEFVLLGRRGKMPKGKTRVDSTWWQVKRTNKHSKKPEFFQDLIERMSDGPRVELFARRPRDGWAVWGNEV